MPTICTLFCLIHLKRRSFLTSSVFWFDSVCLLVSSTYWPKHVLRTLVAAKNSSAQCQCRKRHRPTHMYLAALQNMYTHCTRDPNTGMSRNINLFVSLPKSSDAQVRISFGGKRNGSHKPVMSSDQCLTDRWYTRDPLWQEGNQVAGTITRSLEKTSPSGHFINLLFLILSHHRASILPHSYCPQQLLTYKWL